MGKERIVSVAFLVFCYVFAYLLTIPRTEIPDHLLGHKAFFERDFISKDTGDQLMEMLKDMSVFPSVSSYLKFYTCENEDTGEGVPIPEDGKCPHSFLLPNVNRTKCVLPARIDVGKHFVTSGGVDGLKDSYETLVSRVSPFGAFLYDLTKYPVVQDLFSNKKFKRFAREVCPSDKQVLDPFQFNFIIQLPGQTVATHIDGVYFWGADRFMYPEWLLAAMKFSGLFEDRFIDQVQVVGYVHQWESAEDRDGEFVYYTENADPEAVKPYPLAGSAVDGSKTVHAAIVYRRDVEPPILDKSDDNELVFLEGEKWELRSNGVHRQYFSTDDLRISIVYRGRCFDSEETRIEYNKNPNARGNIALQTIYETLVDELIRRGDIAAEDRTKMLAKENRLELNLLIMDKFIKYPLPSITKAVNPYNHCALIRLFPDLAPFLNLVC
mmetsp:Transcript_9042/g.25351  ORF Transcript_9042/g.25351 Transcript_9042/m.25351 type:complete len:438 (+) Transcript_9042:227-1540(+)|eukprot:CAMPEP_0119131632 /NCGR_PEP_ID=MMETSP1310-20130426/10491_1 /TAXON_ID=464262 /ORGANISM="Genus nov. species nov., Strain RCC2339" /LENGTH=437 /DNA_ID=CAMNT_0007122219 /DNA_START=205 /DNA_END=1518 /DNA_ORIENTATION=-